MFRTAAMVMCLMCAIALAALATAPTQVTVQGRLTDNTGAPLTPGFKSFTFKIFDASSGGTELWPLSPNEEGQFINTDAGGLWSAVIGRDFPLSEAVFVDSVRWLEVVVFDGVNPAVTMPRIRLFTGPYAFRVATVDGASGGSITSKLSIGPGTTNAGVNAFAAGEENASSGDWSTVAGGVDNLAADTSSAVGGGANNKARGRFSTVGGGGGTNPVDSNSAKGAQSTICGGTRNSATAQGAAIGGGSKNLASEVGATIAGGSSNVASGSSAFVGGGLKNTADGNYSTVSGGNKGYALGEFSTIAGGGGSTAADSNLATGAGSTIGGGSRNVASGRHSTVGGGLHNYANGAFATVSGGGGSFPSDSNAANGRCAAVPGGEGNWANGNYSFAAGRRARALHGGTFVWGDSTDADFASTAANQFVIRASGGVGIGATTTPSLLTVYEDGDNIDPATFTGGVADAGINVVTDYVANNYCPGLFWSTQNNNFNKPKAGIFLRTTASGSEIRIGTSNLYTAGITNSALTIDQEGRLGIGDVTPEEKLDVVGNVAVAGTICATGAITALSVGCPSDLRLKRNVAPLRSSLETVGRLRGIEYEWNREEHPDRGFPEGVQVGLIAQEVQEIMPQAVNRQKDGYLTVDYARLVPLLIEGMKEQQRQIEEQLRMIDELRVEMKRQTP